METPIVIHNETELIELLKDNQISIYNVLNNRAHIKGIGHTRVEFSKPIKDLLFSSAVNTIGGRNGEKVRRFLNNGQYLKHFALERLFVENYSDISVKYSAGQDYPAELNSLRKYIYSVV